MEAARLDSHTQETLSAPAVEAALALAERPEALLDKREELGEECQRAVKALFDLAKRLEPKRFTPLPELLVEGFTLDQIWEQLALYNAPLLKYSQRRLRVSQVKGAYRLAGAWKLYKGNELDEELVA